MRFALPVPVFRDVTDPVGGRIRMFGQEIEGERIRLPRPFPVILHCDGIDSVNGCERAFHTVALGENVVSRGKGTAPHQYVVARFRILGDMLSPDGNRPRSEVILREDVELIVQSADK